MTQEEIVDYNKRCAEFIGFKVNKYLPEYPNMFYMKSPKGSLYNGVYGETEEECWKRAQTKLNLFYVDWNWIHEIIEKINSSKPVSITNNDYFDSIVPYLDVKRPIVKGLINNNKEEVVQAINQFLIWYNNEQRT